MLRGPDHYDLSWKHAPAAGVGLSFQPLPRLEIGAEIGVSRHRVDQDGLLFSVGIAQLPTARILSFEGGDLSTRELLASVRYHLPVKAGRKGLCPYLLGVAGSVRREIERVDIEAVYMGHDPMWYVPAEEATDFAYGLGLGADAALSRKLQLMIEVRLIFVDRKQDETIQYMPLRLGLRLDI